MNALLIRFQNWYRREGQFHTQSNKRDLQAAYCAGYRAAINDRQGIIHGEEKAEDARALDTGL